MHRIPNIRSIPKYDTNVPRRVLWVTSDTYRIQIGLAPVNRIHKINIFKLFLFYYSRIK